MVGQVGVREATVRNVGQAVLNLSAIDVSNPRFAHSAILPASIQPGGSILVPITFTPTVVGPEMATLTFLSNAQNGSFSVSATGTGLASGTSILGDGEILFAPTGESAGDQFGICTATAGDVNGDGHPDIIAGAWTNDQSGFDAGRAYIYFGGPSATGSPGLVLPGHASTENFGTSVAAAGDVNGDGYGDVIVGAIGNDAGGTDAGRAYLYLGGSIPNSVADLVITGDVAGAGFGVSVSSAGDVNADGFDDVAVGAFGNEPGATSRGRVLVYFGGPGMDNAPDWILTGEGNGDRFGWAEAPLGDLNGDGFDDLIVGAHQNDAGGSNAGRVYVYHGGTAPNSLADRVFTGDTAGARLGISVGSEDVNGDGYLDLMAGADALGVANAEGRLLVFHGGPGSDAVPDWTLHGEHGGAGFGVEVAGVGDVNADGSGDIVVGSWLESTGGAAAGRAYLFHGGPTADDVPDLTFTGEAAGDRLGQVVGAAGDVNADGVNDLVIGAYFNDAGAEDGGRIYVISVTDGPPPNRPPVMSDVADMTLEEGTVATQELSATDPDGDPLTFTLASGPAFAAVTTTGPVAGLLTVSPGLSDAGTYPASVRATDPGLTSDSETMTIMVTAGNHPPVLAAPSSILTSEGVPFSFQVGASDPDGDHVTLGATNRPVGSLFIDLGNSSGQFSWTPGFGQSGEYEVTFTGRDARGADAAPRSVAIEVGDVNRGPLADPAGPYSGVVNVAIGFDGTGSSDPDGQPLTYVWDFGDQVSGNGIAPLHAYASGGVFIVGLTVTDGSLSASASTTATVQDVFPATGFLEGGNKTVRLQSGRATTLVQLEPTNQAYANSNVDVATIVMISPGTGSVSQIMATGDKTTVGSDKNHNGVAEITAAFSKDGLRSLFSDLSGGRHVVGVTIEGDLASGGRFRTAVELEVIASGNSLAAVVTPNPLRQTGVITFRTTRPGRSRVSIFDISGRVVRQLNPGPGTAVGYHDVGFDGRRQDGTRLPSGVYFYRAEAEEGVASGRFILMQ
jgi:hypothetical protein